jgi:nitrite reductase/ring-hydroxylating ferredoxin subunit
MLEASAHARICDLLGEDPRGPGSAGPRRLPLAEAVKRCPPGGVLAARWRGRAVAVVTLSDGSTHVLPDRCPHDGGWLSDGFVDRDQLVCARHGWEFCPRTGHCLGRPGVTLGHFSASLRVR